MTGTISNSSARPVVLIADDMPEIIDDWTYDLNGYGIGVVTARDLASLPGVFAVNRYQIAAIILDGCMPGNSLNTLGFVKAIREQGFTKPIVAASSLAEYRAIMVAAGCSHEAPKHEAAHLVADLLSTT